MVVLDTIATLAREGWKLLEAGLSRGLFLPCQDNIAKVLMLRCSLTSKFIQYQ